MDRTLRGGIAVFPQSLLSEKDPHSEPLHVSQVMHCLGKPGITIISDSGSAEICAGDLSEWPTGVMDLNPAVKPIYPHRSIGALIIAMENRVSRQLLQSYRRIAGLANLNRARCNLDRDSVVRLKHFIQTSKLITNWTGNLLLVTDGIGQLFAFQPQELNIGTGNKLPWIFSKNQDAKNGRNIIWTEEAQGHHAFFRAPVVPLEIFGRNGLRKIFIQKIVQLKVFERRGRQRLQVRKVDPRRAAVPPAAVFPHGLHGRGVDPP